MSSSFNLATARFLKEARSFHTQKKLGQHFLVDLPKLEEIALALQLAASDLVIEIGAGLGFLTRILRVSGATIVAIDLDRTCTKYLAELALPKVVVKHGDFLSFSLEDLLPANVNKACAVKVAGNIPYQITGPILRHLIGEISKPSPWLSRTACIVLTVQHEVAKRMVARPGSKDYSQLSLFISYFCQATIETLIPGTCFIPAPAVMSAVVKLKPLPSPAVKCLNVRLLGKLIKAGFLQRRKMLRKNLAFLPLSSYEIERVLEEVKLNPQARAEELSLSQFAMLADTIERRLSI